GILPGILLMLLFMIAIVIVTWYNPSLAPPGPKASWEDSFKAFRSGGLWEISIVFIISLGGLFSGWFTPTEAGAVGSISLLVIVSIEKKFSFEMLKLSLYNTTRLTAMVFLLIAAATVFGRFFALTRIPAQLGILVTELQLPSFAVMGIVILIYFVLGFVVDALALIVITIPIFYPLIINTLGYDPIWFGVVVLLVVSLGVITPPIGLNVYVMKGVAPEVPLETIFKGVWPFVIALLVCIAILIAFPPIATFLPNLFY
ncbi:MAG: TRAP transporter large permease subunit, partial [Desulfobacterales bacterium]